MSGFSVFQPTLGAALQWLPALGTAELDEMIHATIPGMSSIQDKRAHIAMDFFEFSQQTGKNFKFYPAPASFASTTAASPANSVALYDSGYGSSFNASPIVSDMSPWTPSSNAYTPSVSADETKAKSQSGTSRKSTSSSSKQTDFSSHPGMRIMTKDGRDVTNSASRGCKSKEQRDHAHLMRIIKACDACKRKKIRCDPSHKKRTASQASASSQQEAKPAKKAKKSSPTLTPAWDIPSFLVANAFDTPEGASSSPFEYSPEEELWSQFVLFDQEQTTLASNFNPDDYDFSDTFDFGVQDLLTPSSSASSISPSRWFTPLTPAPPVPSPPVIVSETLADTSPQNLTVPYLNSGSHDSNYVDFNLYSPPTDFFLDEEPLPARKAPASNTYRLQSPQPSGVDSQEIIRQSSAADGTVATSTGEYYSSPSSFHSDTFHSDSHQSSVRRLDEYRYATTLTMPSPSDGLHVFSQAQDNHVTQGPDARGVVQSRSQTIELASPSLSASQQRSVNSDSHGGSQLLDHAVASHFSQPSHQSEVAASVSQRVPQSSSGIGRPSDHYDPGTLAPSLASWSQANTQTTVSRGSAAHGRPLSTGQQQQTLSTHAAATPQQSASRPHESVVLGLAERCRASVSSTALSPGDYCRATSASPLLVSSSLEFSSPDGHTGVGARSGDISNHALTAVLAAVLISTSSMRRLVGGEPAKNEQTMSLSSSSFALSQLAVFGLVSSLLAVALQNNLLGTEADLWVFLNVLIITSISFASMHQRCTRSSVTVSSPQGTTPLPVPSLTSTIDNVKSKIQAMGQKVDGLRCAVSHRLRALLPRPRSLNSIRF